jgi:hypothetical protein
VTRDKSKWRAFIDFQGQRRYLGSFGTEEEAARAYDKKAKRLWANPILNFLPDGSLNPNRKKRVRSQSLIARPAAKRRPSSGSSEEEEEEDDEEEEEEEEEDSKSSSSSSSSSSAHASSSSTIAAATAHQEPLLVDIGSILVILDDDSGDDDDDDDEQQPPLQSSGIPRSERPLGGAVPPFGPDPVGALRSYATYRFVELDDEEGDEEMYTALRLLSMVRAGVGVEEGSEGVVGLTDSSSSHLIHYHHHNTTTTNHRGKARRSPSCRGWWQGWTCRTTATTRSRPGSCGSSWSRCAAAGAGAGAGAVAGAES